MIIGVFTKHKNIPDRSNLYHCSNCKILKIIEELKGICEFDLLINNYNADFDFAIVDRISPKGLIRSRYILNISEYGFDLKGATDACSVSPSVRAGKNKFVLMNYCHGNRGAHYLSSAPRDKIAYIGRLSGVAEEKIRDLNSKGVRLGVYPIKYWRGKEILRFSDQFSDSLDNLRFLQSKISGSVILPPHSHDSLYEELGGRGYYAGFVPSIYPCGKKRVQKESSSKFFEYIGAGLPVLIEQGVPEAAIVGANPFLGEVFCGKKEMISKAKLMRNKKYSYSKIAKYAEAGHFPDSRAKTLFNNFIKGRI